jgi:hypothetical protein
MMKTNRKLPFMDAPTQIDLHSMLEELELEDLISSCDNVSEHFRYYIASQCLLQHN